MNDKQPKESTLTIRISPDELQRLDNEWKNKKQFFTRTQFIKAAINNMSEGVVFE